MRFSKCGLIFTVMKQSVFNKAMTMLVGATIIVVFSVSLNRSTSPTIPLNQYNVSGALICDSAALLKDYTVQLFGKEFGSENFVPVYASYGGGSSIALTDSSGKFFLSTSSYQYYDSLKIGLIQPGKEIIYSKTVYADRSTAHKYYYTPSSDDSPGCNSCNSTVEPASQSISQYSFYFYDMKISFCP